MDKLRGNGLSEPDKASKDTLLLEWKKEPIPGLEDRSGLEGLSEKLCQLGGQVETQLPIATEWVGI
jgi:hypothetical protein